MSEMIERVARAICRVEMGDKAFGLGAWTEEQFAGAVEADWSYFVPEARAAIGAMREPTEAMKQGFTDVGKKAYAEHGVLALSTSDAYRAMIDAALK